MFRTPFLTVLAVTLATPAAHAEIINVPDPGNGILTIHNDADRRFELDIVDIGEVTTANIKTFADADLNM